MNFCAHSARLLRKPCFVCIDFILNWNKKFVDNAWQCFAFTPSVFSSSQSSNVDILPDHDKIPQRPFKIIMTYQLGFIKKNEMKVLCIARATFCYIHFCYKIELILCPRVRNSTTHLTLIHNQQRGRERRRVNKNAKEMNHVEWYGGLAY